MALSALIVMLAGCGNAGSARAPDLTRLPLIDGAQIVAQGRQCDSGTGGFCALTLVIVDRHYRSSTDLLVDEHARLRRFGWTGANGDTGEEHAADAPGHKLHVTYATADGDLKGIDLGWIQRPRQITLALSHALFDRVPALSIMLEVGST